MNDTVDRFYQATGELMVKASDYDALSARCEELERRLAGAWVVRELEWKHEKGNGCVRAETQFGTLRCGQILSAEVFFWELREGRYTIGNCSMPSLDAAKAAAQQWYAEKMTAGLRRVV